MENKVSYENREVRRIWSSFISDVDLDVVISSSSGNVHGAVVQLCMNLAAAQNRELCVEFSRVVEPEMSTVVYEPSCMEELQSEEQKRYLCHFNPTNRSSIDILVWLLDQRWYLYVFFSIHLASVFTETSTMKNRRLRFSVVPSPGRSRRRRSMADFLVVSVKIGSSKN